MSVAKIADNIRSSILEPLLGAFSSGSSNMVAKDAFIQAQCHVTGSCSKGAAQIQCCRKGLDISFFKTSNYVRSKETIPEPVEGTCQWFFSGEKYVQWLENAGEDLLLLTADPVAGKSVLSKALLDKVAAIESSTTLYFFFSEDSKHQRGAATALCALIHQLFSQHEHLFATYGIHAHSLHGLGLTSDFDALWDLLFAAVRDSGSHRVFLVLDGLDECQDDERGRLIRKLKEFYRNRKTSPSSSQKAIIKIFATSRPYQEIESAFDDNGLPAGVRFAAENQAGSISSDVELVAKARLEHLERFRGIRQDSKEATRAMLLVKKNWTYLWLKHAMDVDSDRSPGSLKGSDSVTSALPHGIADFYESVLSRLPDQKRATNILEIVVAATRPLTLSEMDVALAMQANYKSLQDPQLHGDDRTAIHLRYVCGSFLIIADSRIYFVHPTARSYLLEQTENGSESWKGSFNELKCHLTLATICKRYNSFSRLQTEYPGFQEYSICNWAERGSPDTALTLMKALVHENLHPSDRLDTPLLVSAWYGHEPFVRAVLAKKPDLDVEANFGCRALHIAASRGHEKIVLLLLDAGANPNMGRWGGGTALHVAVEKGFEKIVGMLLKAGANPNAYDEAHGTTFHIAARRCDVKIAKMLLGAHVDLSVELLKKGTAFWAAAAAGRDGIRDMLSKVPGINTRPNDYWRDIVIAALRGNEEFLAILLRTHSIAKDPFQHSGPREIERGDVVGIEVRNGQTAIETYRALYRMLLKRAAAIGNVRMVTFLLDLAKDISIDVLGINTALRAAAAGGHLDIVDRFVQLSKASVNVWGKQYGCALHAAAWGGHAEVVERLLLAGADVHAQNDFHGTPIHVAAGRGHRDVMTLLLSHPQGDTVNAQWQDHGTPLYAAAELGHVSTVEALLSKGADLNIPGGRFGNPLQAAREGNHSQIVDMLIRAEQKRTNGEEKMY